MSHTGFALTAIVAVSALAGTTQATTVQVCPTCAHHTIQGAIDSAASGDTIEIAASVYTENLTIIGKKLTLHGSAGATEVRGTRAGPTVVLGAGSGKISLLVTIDGLTVSNGNHAGGSGIGGGIQVRQGAYLHLSNSNVHNNTAAAGGGGVGVNTPGGPATTIDNTTITNNQSGNGGGIYVAPGSTVIVTGSTVAGNTAQFGGGSGGGIYNASNSTLELEQTTITHNSGLNGAGVFADYHSHTTIAQSALTENTGVQFCRRFVGCFSVQGVGLWVASDFSVSDSTISHNGGTAQEGTFGGGIYVIPQGKAMISGTVIAFNNTIVPQPGTPGYGEGGGIFVDARVPTDKLVLDDVYVINNQASSYSAGGIQNSGTLVLSDVTLKDNTGANCSGGTGCP